MRVGTGHGPLGSWRAALIILLTHVSDISWRARARRLCLLEPVTNAVSMFSNNRFVKVLRELIGLTLITCFFWCTSVMTHLFMAHQLGLNQLIFICTKWEDWFLVTCRFQLVSFFVCSIPVPFVISYYYT